MLYKDDVVYYKVALKKLFVEALKNDIEVEIEDGMVSFINNKSHERTSVNNNKKENN